MGGDLIPREGEVLIYTTPNGAVRVEVFYEGETFWLTPTQIGVLFGTSGQAFSYHLQTMFDSNELQRAATRKEILQVQTEGSLRASGPQSCSRRQLSKEF